MFNRLCLVLLISSPLFAGDFTEKLTRDLTTVTLEAAPTIHIVNSRGEVAIEGWDRPDVEITVMRYAMKKDAPLDRLQVKSQRHGDEIEIRTLVGKDNGRDVLADYAIHAPRASKLVIDALNGGVYTDGIGGEIHAIARRGQITLRVASAPALEAHTKRGQVYSEFPTEDKRHAWMRYDVTAAGGGQKLDLRTEWADIVILKTVAAP